MGFLVSLGFFQGGELAFGQDQPLLGHFGFEGFEAELHGCEIVAQPDAAHAEWRDADAAFEQFVGGACLAPGGLLDGDGEHGLLDLGGDAVLEDGLATGEFREGEFAAFVVEFLEAIEAVARIAHDFAGLGDIAELLGQFEQAGFGADDLLVLGHDGVLWLTPADTVCQIKSRLYK